MKIYTIIIAILMTMPLVLGNDLELLSTDPAPPVAGEYVDLTVRLSADTIDRNLRYEGVTLEIRENKYIRILGEEKIELGTLQNDAPITRTFRVYLSEELPGGTITIPFEVDLGERQQRYDLELFIKDANTVPDLRVGQIESIPDELLPDTENNKITLTLQNLGETEAELVRAELIIPNKDVYASYAYSLEDSVSSIDAGDEAELEFIFDVEEEVRQSINSELTLRYRSRESVTDTYRVFEKTIPLTIPLTDSPYLKVTNVEFENLKPGTTENEIKITIKNEGNKKAESVRIRLFPDISYPFSFEQTTAYISSELEEGEEAKIIIKAEVTKSGIARTYPIEVELESLVGESLYTRDDRVTLEVIPGRTFSNRSLGFVMMGIVIIIAIALNLYTRKKNRKKR